MEMVGMKMSARAKAEMAEPTPTDPPRYPWGLSLTLDEDSLDKLGMSALPEVGETRHLMAAVTVTSCSSNESESGKHRSVTLQITEMALGEPPKDSSAHAEKLYGKA